MTGRIAVNMDEIAGLYGRSARHGAGVLLERPGGYNQTVPAQNHGAGATDNRLKIALRQCRSVWGATTWFAASDALPEVVQLPASGVEPPLAEPYMKAILALPLVLLLFR